MLVSGGSLKRTDQLIHGKEIWKYVLPAIASEIGFFLKKSSFSANPAWQSGPGYGGTALLFISPLAVDSKSFTITLTAGPLSPVIPDALDPDGRQA